MVYRLPSKLLLMSRTFCMLYAWIGLSPGIVPFGAAQLERDINAIDVRMCLKGKRGMFTKDGLFISLVEQEKGILIYDIIKRETGYIPLSSACKSMDVSPCGEYLIAVLSVTSAHVIDIKTKKCVQKTVYHRLSGSMNRIKWLANGGIFLFNTLGRYCYYRGPFDENNKQGLFMNSLSPLLCGETSLRGSICQGKSIPDRVISHTRSKRHVAIVDHQGEFGLDLAGYASIKVFKCQESYCPGPMGVEVRRADFDYLIKNLTFTDQHVYFIQPYDESPRLIHWREWGELEQKSLLWDCLSQSLFFSVLVDIIISYLGIPKDTLLQEIKEFDDPREITACEFSLNGDLLAIAYKGTHADKEKPCIEVYQVDTGAKLIERHEIASGKEVERISWSPDSCFIAMDDKSKCNTEIVFTAVGSLMGLCAIASKLRRVLIEEDFMERCSCLV